VAAAFAAGRVRVAAVPEVAPATAGAALGGDAAAAVILALAAVVAAEGLLAWWFSQPAPAPAKA